MRKLAKEAMHGGARKGAGKKPSLMGVKVTKSHRFTPEVSEFLATIEKESEFIEGLIRRSRPFKAWQQGE